MGLFYRTVTNYRIFIFIGFILQGCWICPDPVSIEFNSGLKIIQVLSEDYYVESVTIHEYVSKAGYVQLIGSNKLTIDQKGARGATTLSILSAVENYNRHGDNALLNKKNLQYEVRLKRFGNKKKSDLLDVEIIEFVEDSVNQVRKYNSVHPCP